MKVILRLLHFLIYFFHHMAKAVHSRSQRWTGHVRYWLLIMCYFTDDRIIQSYKERLTKSIAHTSICVNDFRGTNEELHRMSLLISWLIIAGARIISVVDESKSICADK